MVRTYPDDLGFPTFLLWPADLPGLPPCSNSEHIYFACLNVLDINQLAAFLVRKMGAFVDHRVCPSKSNIDGPHCVVFTRVAIEDNHEVKNGIISKEYHSVLPESEQIVFHILAIIVPTDQTLLEKWATLMTITQSLPVPSRHVRNHREV